MTGDLRPAFRPGGRGFVGAVVAEQVPTQIGACALPALLSGHIERWHQSKIEAGRLVGVFFAAYVPAVPVLLALADRVPAHRRPCLNGLVPGGTLPCGKGVSAVVNHEGGHRMRKSVVPVAALAGLLATAGASAQDTQPQHGGMQHGGTTQTAPMQGGMAMGGCPMMQRSAAMEQRLRRLEERMGMQTPPTPPSVQPGSPG